MIEPQQLKVYVKDTLDIFAGSPAGTNLASCVCAPFDDFTPNWYDVYYAADAKIRKLIKERRKRPYKS